jgi:amino acid adenylation domain-containing protein
VKSPTLDEKRRLVSELLRARAARTRARAVEAASDNQDDTRLVIVPVERQGTLPLAVPQERFWFLQQLNPASSADNIAVATRIRGPFSTEAFLEACRGLIQRHEILRTRLPVVDGAPAQVIAPEAQAAAETVDLRHVPSEDRDRTAMAALSADVEQPFDLLAGPLLRFRLLRLADDDHIALTVIHHIVADAWSINLMTAEVVARYRSHLRGERPALPPAALQYADFAVCHRRWLESVALQRQAAYWTKTLAGLKRHELPSDRGRRSGPHSGASGDVPLSAVLFAAVRELAGREHATPFMVCLAAFAIVMARYTGHEDVVVGTPIANRTAPGVEGMLGTFVNTLVLRIDVSGAATFRTLLARVRRVALDAYANQDLSFDRLVSLVDPERDTGRSPLFQVLFNMTNVPLRTEQDETVTAENVTLPRRVAQFDLTVSIDTVVDNRIHYRYSEALFDASTIDRFIGHYRRILEVATAGPDAPISDLEMLSPEERATILQTWNATEQAFPDHETVVSLFEAQASRTPESPAVVCGEDTLTYADVLDRSNEVAACLRSRGVVAGHLVGVCLERSARLVPALLGILKTGAAYLPLDPSFPADRLSLMVSDSGTSVVVTERSLLPVVPADVRAICLDDDVNTGPAGAARAEPGTVTPSGLAYVLYTSGSTGRPKGVEISHRALCNFLLSMRSVPGIAADDRLLAVTTLSFDIAGLELYLPLLVGARVVVATRDEAADPARLAALVKGCGITMLQATPATWRMLLDDGWTGDKGLTILCGGEALPRSLADELLSRARAVWNLYGPTETTVWSTAELVRPGTDPVSIGRPIANTTVYVLDGALKPVPIGVPGDLFIGGAGLAEGYRGRADLTSKAFISNPFDGRPGARMYRTGDIARFRPDGRLEWLGRTDDQVKIRGFRIELAEIESTLLLHGSVRQCVVVARTDAAGTQRLVAYVVRSRSDPEGETLRDFVGRRLPPYMVPSVFVDLEVLPLTASGKIDRGALPAPQIEPIRVGDGAPASPLEQSLVRIWTDVLGVPAVGVQDDFFELGGHSLLAVRLMAEIENAHGRHLPLATLFDARTVRGLATLLERDSATAGTSLLVPIQSRGTRPPFFCVHGVGGEVLGYAPLASHMAPDQPFVAIRASGWEPGTAPVHTIEDQAALYIREMIKYQPDGPYYIGGYSHGGRVALEMALQLSAMNRAVAFVGILDTTPFEVRYTSFRYVMRALRNVPLWLWYDAARTPWPENRRRLVRAFGLIRRHVAALLPAGRHRRGQVAQSDVRDFMDLSDLPERYQRMYVEDYEAFIRYRPSAMCRAVTVFRACGQPLLATHEPDLNWRRASHSVEVRTVRGNHSSILTEPYVRELARELNAALEAAQQRASVC